MAALNILRKFRLGKNIMVERVQDEVSYFLKELSNHVDHPVDIGRSINMGTANITSSILTGRRFDYTDKTFLCLMEDIFKFFRATQQASLLFSFPILKLLPVDVFQVKSIRDNLQEIYRHVRHFIDLGKDGDPENNFVAVYIAEREARLKSGQATTLDYTNLTKVIFDLILVGTDTTATTIYWCVLFSLNYPDVQKKVFAEIKDQIGMERPPCVNDKHRLPYLNAVIMETQRMASIFPQSVARTNHKDVAILDYIIPKDTLILPNLDSVMFDEKTWGTDVTTFNPDRFFDQEGQLKTMEELIPFGIVRRMCPGEVLAKTELFLFLASMFQRFQFLPENPTSPPTMNYTFSLVVSPETFRVILIDRLHK